MHPIVDVLLPTYRPKPSHLREALDSLFAQIEQRWQLWVRDEPTEVDTQAMLSPYLGDERIHFEHNEHCLGIGGNWNACLRHGAAPHVQFLFQDDVWQPTYLETALRTLKEHPGIGFVSLGHDYRFEDESSAGELFLHVQQVRAGIASGTHEGKELLLEWIDRGLHPNIIGEPSFVMLRRSAVEKTGTFRDDMVQNLDAEYWIRMLSHTSWYCVPGDFGTFRVHAGAASTRHALSGEGIFDRLRMLRQAQKVVSPEQKGRVQTALRHQRRAMVQKFLERYGSSVKPLRGQESVFMYVLRQPWIAARSCWQYARRRFGRER